MATAAATGLVTIVMVQGWLDVIEGPWLLNAAVIALAVLAIASLVAALMALIGLVGLALGAVLMVFVGNPWSGVASAPELLPKAAGLIGRLLPPGAGGNAPAQHRFLRRRRQRWPARGAPGLDRAGPGRHHGRSGDAAAQNAGHLIKIEDDSLIGDPRRPPHRSANGPSVVSALPFCTRTVVAPRRAAPSKAINETYFDRDSASSSGDVASGWLGRLAPQAPADGRSGRAADNCGHRCSSAITVSDWQSPRARLEGTRARPARGGASRGSGRGRA